MSDNRCTHGEDHSYCPECIDGPQPLQARLPIGGTHAISPAWAEASGIAVTAAVGLAPVVASAKPGDDAVRGLEVEFESVEAATYARDEVNRALQETEWSGRVSAWVWQLASSTGGPLTAAGRASGIELRLQPLTAK